MRKKGSVRNYLLIHCMLREHYPIVSARYIQLDNGSDIVSVRLVSNRFFFLIFMLLLGVPLEVGASLPAPEKQHNTTYSNAVSIESLRERALALYKKGDYKQAISTFLAISKILEDQAHEADLSTLGRTYTYIAQSYKRLKLREETAAFYRKALATYKRIDSKRNIARTLNTLAEAERYLGNLDTSLNLVMESLRIHGTIDDEEGKAKAHMGASIILRHIENYELSLEHLKLAYAYFKRENNAVGTAKTANEIAHLYGRLASFEEAKSFYEVALQYPADQLPPATIATALRELAEIEVIASNFQKARSYATRAMAIYETLNAPEKKTAVFRIIGDSYQGEDNLNQAIYNYQASLDIANQLDNDLFRVKALLPVGNVYLKQDLAKSERAFKTALTFSKDLKNKTYRLAALKGLREVYTATGQFQDALEFAEKELALTEQIQSENSDKLLEIAKAKLLSFKLENEVEALKEQTRLDELEIARKNNEIEISRKEQQIANLQLSKERYAKIMLSLIVIVLVTIALALYRSYVTSRRKNEKLHYLATHDSLTECFNRRYLFDSLRSLFAQAPGSHSGCLVMIDIDHFKKINDDFGHNVGDDALRGVAHVLRQNISDGDVLARFGGEEFCMVLHNTSLEDAMAVSEKVRAQMENHTFGKIKLTCSIGVTSLALGASSPTELIEQADKALFFSKANGRNQVNAYSAT